FCKQEFVPPVEISTRLGYFTGGSCNCGAVYCFDASGKNMGEAFLDALSFACREDWDKAMSLESDVDYEEVYLNYNPNRHSLQNRGNHNYGSDLVFVRLKTNGANVEYGEYGDNGDGDHGDHGECEKSI
ncbi:MAG: hypothetical protein HQK93_04215, partial [Nitrospirae bacterium]|nr:hypothetical protein [Nitrospirota bacterium]